MADIKVVQSHLTTVMHYLLPLLPLANCHMVNFLSGNFWDKFVPCEIQREYDAVGLSEIYELFWNSMKYCYTSKVDLDNCTFHENAPFLSKFFLDARAMSLGALHNVTLSYEEFQGKLSGQGLVKQNDIFIEEFMSPKKTHEVEIMSQVVSAVARISGIYHIADVGGGKGYLSCMLALQHGLHVLGIDSSWTNTHGAVKRTEKLQKCWPGLCRRAVNRSSGRVPAKKGKHWKAKKSEEGSADSEGTISALSTEVAETSHCGTSLYKQTTAYVTEQSNMKDLMQEHFADCGSCALVGLHTCGNLAPTCLKLFAQTGFIRALCNVGCCYHLVEEQFCSNNFNDPPELPAEHGTGCGFPMSEFLSRQGFVLGRNARMLAAQAVDRLSEKQEVPVTSLFYRALLQMLLIDKFAEERSEWQVGRIASKCKDFVEYYNKSLMKLNIDLELTAAEVEAECNKFIGQRGQLEAFYLMRISLAPVIEAVILLDRLLFLVEQGVQEAHIVQLFNPVISPRCYGILALKDHFQAVTSTL